MSNTYTATANITASHALPDHRDALAAWITDAYAAMVRKIDSHMILTRSTYSATRARGTYFVQFTYRAAGDGEAVSIVHDAARAAGVAIDAVRVTCGGDVVGTHRAYCRSCGGFVTGVPVADPASVVGVDARRALIVRKHECATPTGFVRTDGEPVAIVGAR